MVERRSPKPNVVGSNPTGPARIKFLFIDDVRGVKRVATIQQAKKTPKGISAFAADTRGELRKVEWPNKAAVIKSTIVIVVMLIFFTGYVTALDMGLSKLILQLKGL